MILVVIYCEAVQLSLVEGQCVQKWRLEMFIWISVMMSQQRLLSMFEEERKKASFQKAKLTSVIYGSDEEAKNFMERQKIIEKDPVLRFDPSNIHRAREELMTIHAKKLIRYTEVMPENPLKILEKTLFFQQQMPLSLHEVMFLPTLRNLCDEEQVQTLLKPAQRCQIIGCYAQTELGHGSDIKSLMTTATYDEASQSFIMNSPTTKAAKWWIGDLGVFATHAAVFAQLYIKGKCYGLHAFVVPIRDHEHKPLPGVEVGDVGPKIGYNCKDNGFLLLNNVRIPRKNMLMKFHRVSKEGKYEIVGDEKITYATMLRVRSLIPRGVYYHLSKGTTIIVRYSLARRQFKDNKGVEIPLLDYQLQQEKVFPRIAETYANLFALKAMEQLSDFILSEAKQGRFNRLNEAHVLTSSIKAVTTKDGLQGLQTLRRAGGGQGFSSYSAIPALQTEIMPTYTFEGDFTILMLQVARYLLKSLNRLQRGSQKPLGESVTYMRHLAKDENFTLDSADPLQIRNPQNIIKAYINNSCEKIKKAGEKLLQGVTSGMEMKKTWDQLAGGDLVEASTAHSYNWMVTNFYQSIEKITDLNTRNAMQRVFLLYALQKIIENSTSFFETKSVTPSAMKAIRQVRNSLLAEIRPDALALVEAFEYSDNTLMSAIGKADGKPYQTILDWAKNYNDVNRPEVRAEFRQISKGLQKFHRDLTNAKL